MKKKWLIIALIMLLLIVVSSLIFSLLPSSTTQQEKGHIDEQDMNIMEDCWERVTNCQIVEQNNGMASVVLVAPDYASLISILTETEQEPVTNEMIVEAIKDNPQLVKEYSFVADNLDDNTIKATLMEQISYELIASILINIEE